MNFEVKFTVVSNQATEVRTEAVPCDFVLVASGNIDTVRRMHPALRSRIRGYGYEIAVNHSMPDTMENRRKLVRFTAQEITKDGKIPHFSRCCLIIGLSAATKGGIYLKFENFATK